MIFLPVVPSGTVVPVTDSADLASQMIISFFSSLPTLIIQRFDAAHEPPQLHYSSHYANLVRTLQVQYCTVFPGCNPISGKLPVCLSLEELPKGGVSEEESYRSTTIVRLYYNTGRTFCRKVRTFRQQGSSSKTSVDGTQPGVPKEPMRIMSTAGAKSRANIRIVVIFYADLAPGAAAW